MSVDRSRSRDADLDLGGDAVRGAATPGRSGCRPEPGAFGVLDLGGGRGPRPRRPGRGHPAQRCRLRRAGATPAARWRPTTCPPACTPWSWPSPGWSATWRGDAAGDWSPRSAALDEARAAARRRRRRPGGPGGRERRPGRHHRRLRAGPAGAGAHRRPAVGPGRHRPPHRRGRRRPAGPPGWCSTPRWRCCASRPSPARSAWPWPPWTAARRGWSPGTASTPGPTCGSPMSTTAPPRDDLAQRLGGNLAA